MTESYKIKDVLVKDGKVEIRWLYLWERLLITALLAYPMMKGFELGTNGLQILRGLAPAGSAASGWTRFIVGWLVVIACLYCMSRIFDNKGRIILQLRRFRDNVVPFPRGGRPKK